MNSSKKILILAANPKNTRRLRIDEEVREIRGGLERSKYRDNFTIYPQLASRFRDVRRAMLDYEPQLVHFCGHSELDGLMIEDDNGMAILFTPIALTGLFELCADCVECVVLNACYSDGQAEAINQHIEYVIGMRTGIPDKAAIEFAIGFYDALGAGKSIEMAFKFGCNAILFYNISEELAPILRKKRAIGHSTDLGMSPKEGGLDELEKRQQTIIEINTWLNELSSSFEVQIVKDFVRHLLVTERLKIQQGEIKSEFRFQIVFKGGQRLGREKVNRFIVYLFDIMRRLRRNLTLPSTTKPLSEIISDILVEEEIQDNELRQQTIVRINTYLEDLETLSYLQLVKNFVHQLLMAEREKSIESKIVSEFWFSTVFKNG